MTEKKKDDKLKFSGEMKPAENLKVSKIRGTEITFKESRKFDLHIGRNMVAFYGRETKIIPAEWIEHKDWDNVKQFFVVKGGLNAKS